MAHYKITKPNKALLKTASRQFIANYFISIPEARRSARWIRVGNRYRLHCTTRYDKDIESSPPRVDDQQLSEYICGSAPTHVIDAWSYLGRAVEATLRGDTYAAAHLGYYCELRATMGLLASEGIGVFNQGHPVVKTTGATARFPTPVRPNRRPPKAGTHRVVWPILNYWSSLQRASDLLDQIVSPRSVHLSQWLSGTGGSLPVRAVAQHWFRAWGIDLTAVDDDHESRNLSSYRPSQFRKPASLDVHETVTFVEEL